MQNGASVNFFLEKSATCVSPFLSEYLKSMAERPVRPTILIPCRSITLVTSVAHVVLDLQSYAKMRAFVDT